jgi:hypothetical protein
VLALQQAHDSNPLGSETVHTLTCPNPSQTILAQLHCQCLLHWIMLTPGMAP